jgi:hypothetical protein
MERTLAYYRARLEAFNQLINEEVQSNPSKDSLDLRLLRNGVIPGKMKSDFKKLIKEKIVNQENSKLRFDEITRFNTWFEIHPEKIAGKEVITSSIEFPLKIKGTQEDIIQTVTPSVASDKKEKRIRMAIAKAIARKRSLELIKI